MSDNRRMNSIARRMGRSWTRRLFAIFLWLDIAIALIAISGYCFTLETGEFGAFDIELNRGLNLDTTGDVREILGSARYVVTDDDGDTYSFELGPFLRPAGALMLVLLVIELLLLLGQSKAGQRSANKLLRPLNQMIQTTQRLSASRFEEARFETLEHAIENIEATSPNARVKTGAKELQGLEGAINDLLKRTHESYTEQLRFVSDASHELRTPIAVIQGYSSMLERWGKHDETILDESIQAIKGEAEHMNKLVEQLLFLARGDSGRTDLAVEQFNLTEMIREVYEEYQMIDGMHDFSFYSSGEVNCVADPAMLKQVARILTDNAIRYSPEGGDIALRVFDDVNPSFQVQDSGIGMADSDVPHIFERFYRSDPARTRATGGTGLGLSIAKWIVERHGGYFDVLTRQGIGTRITVHIPLIEIKKTEEETPPAVGR